MVPSDQNNVGVLDTTVTPNAFTTIAIVDASTGYAVTGSTKYVGGAHVGNKVT